MVKTFRVGIAGYMGAGKSTCARSFESENALVLDADAEAKRLMEQNRAIQDGLREAFGEAVVGPDGGINYGALGRAAFESIDALLTLNGITHPPLAERLDALVSGCKKPLCVMDAALIPILGIESWFDLCVWVDAPFKVRLERIAAKRTDLPEREIAVRMRMQEAVMGVPDGGDWAVVADTDCRGYIAGAFKKHCRGGLRSPVKGYFTDANYP
jgi:dephospho-CoA kinase